MFTDMVGTLRSRSETLALELLEEHRRICDQFFRALTAPKSKRSATRCCLGSRALWRQSNAALEIQRTLAKRNPDVSSEELASQQLETGLRASDASYALSYGALKLMPFWDPLRGDPRFEKIVNSLAPK